MEYLACFHVGSAVPGSFADGVFGADFDVFLFRYDCPLFVVGDEAVRCDRLCASCDCSDGTLGVLTCTGGSMLA